LAEGTGSEAAEEIVRLRELGALDERTVLIHAVGLEEAGWRMVRESGAGVIWCPRSNLFTLGRSLAPEVIRSGVPLALGTDSPLTAEGDILDEINAARELAGADDTFVRDLVSGAARKLLRLPPQPEDWIAAPGFGEPPELVIIAGRLRLISPALAGQLQLEIRAEFFPMRMEGRPPVLVRWNTPRLLEDTRRFLGDSHVRLAGREVSA
jgi:hypothetical protein